MTTTATVYAAGGKEFPAHNIERRDIPALNEGDLVYIPGAEVIRTTYYDEDIEGPAEADIKVTSRLHARLKEVADGAPRWVLTHKVPTDATVHDAPAFAWVGDHLYHLEYASPDDAVPISAHEVTPTPPRRTDSTAARRIVRALRTLGVRPRVYDEPDAEIVRLTGAELVNPAEDVAVMFEAAAAAVDAERAENRRGWLDGTPLEIADRALRHLDHPRADREGLREIADRAIFAADGTPLRVAERLGLDLAEVHRAKGREDLRQQWLAIYGRHVNAVPEQTEAARRVFLARRPGDPLPHVATSAAHRVGMDLDEWRTAAEAGQAPAPDTRVGEWDAWHDTTLDAYAANKALFGGDPHAAALGSAITAQERLRAAEGDAERDREERDAAVMRLLNLGWSEYGVAQVLEVSRPTVANIRKRAQ